MQVKSIAEWQQSAILLTFIKLPFVIKDDVLSIVELSLQDRVYCMQFNISGTKRRTIYTYSTVSVDPSLIEEGTVVTFTPKQSK